MGTLPERVSYLEGRVEEQSQTFAAIRESLAELSRDLSTRMDRLERRVDGLDDKMSRQFLWIVGIQITTLVAVVGAVLSRG